MTGWVEALVIIGAVLGILSFLSVHGHLIFHDRHDKDGE